MVDHLAETIGIIIFILCYTAQPSIAFEDGDEYQQCSIVSATTANRRFSYALYKVAARITPSRRNILLSPLAVGMSLSMLASAATGYSSKQLLKVLEQRNEAEAPLDRDCLLSAYHGNRFNTQFLFKDPAEREDTASLRTATRLFGEQNLTFSEYFVQSTGRYGAEMAVVPFKSVPRDAERLINTWIRDQTQGNILHMIRPGTIAEDTMIALTCALYFKATWLAPWTNASKGNFHVYNGKKRQVHYMTSRAPVRYISSSNLMAEMSEIPYASPDGSNIDASLILILPFKNSSIREVEKRLSDEFILDLMTQNETDDIVVQLPKFQLLGEQKLKLFLKRMGVRLIFNKNNAKLSDAIDQEGGKRKRIYVGRTYHKARFEIDENGTQGDALYTYNDSLTETAEQIVKHDRPFIFLLYDKFTDSIIYFGRMADPTRRVLK